jgi:hypothetical protein
VCAHYVDRCCALRASTARPPAAARTRKQGTHNTAADHEFAYDSDYPQAGRVMR